MRKNTVPSFIQKTFEILQQQKNNEVIGWSASGCSFVVVDRQRLCNQILPVYFKHSNFSSFVRQLNMYNFHKKRNNEEKLQFFHKLFRKDRKELLIGLKRKPSEAQILLGDQLIAKLDCGTNMSTIIENNFSENSSHRPQNQNYSKQISPFAMHQFVFPFDNCEFANSTMEHSFYRQMSNSEMMQIEHFNGLNFSVNMLGEQNKSSERKPDNPCGNKSPKPWSYYHDQNLIPKIKLDQPSKQIWQKQQPKQMQKQGFILSRNVLINSDLSNRAIFGNSMTKVVQNIILKQPPSNQSQNY